MEKQNLHARDTKISKGYSKQESSRRVVLILASLFQINWSELHMWMVFCSGFSPRQVMKGLLIHLNITDINIIGGFQREEMSHNLYELSFRWTI